MAEGDRTPGGNDASGNAQGGDANGNGGNNAPFAIRQIRYEIQQARREIAQLKKEKRSETEIKDAQDKLKELERTLEKMTSGAGSDRRDERRDYLRGYYNELGGAWVARLVKEDPELRKLIEEAIRKGWDQQEFSDALYQTKWWKDPEKSGSWKSAFQMEFSADQTAWNDAIDQAKLDIAQAAQDMYNLDVPQDVLDKIARRYLYQGWSKNNNRGLKIWLATQFQSQSGNPESGYQAGGLLTDYERQLREAARGYGVQRPEDWYGKTAQKILDPNANFTEDDAWNELIRDAEGLYPVFAGKLSKDRSVRDVAGGYISQLARYLEINDPSMIELSDPLLQKAFTNLDQNSNPSLMPLWQFTQEIKKDARWQYTTNALDTYASIGSDLAKMMGFVK